MSPEILTGASMDSGPEIQRNIDPNSDPAKLAWIGQTVRMKLARNPNVIPVDVENLELLVYRNFLSDAECRILIAKIDANAVPSTLYKGTEQPGFRTSYSCHLNRSDPDIANVEKRMSAILGIPNRHAETMQGQRYTAGQEFKAHHDFFHPGQGYWDHEGPNGGQRSWTAMIYLNMPDEGGATEFPHVNIGIRPEAGTMLMWNNCNPDGTLNYKTLHTGTPVIKGVKHVITKWYRQNDWLALNGG
jgi:prolyl 4-hydroxylase